MKKITIAPYKILSLIFTVFSIINSSFAAPSLIGGTIQFSKDSTAVELNINYSGSQINTTFHATSSPKITFEIPKSNNQTHFELLITSAKIDYQLKERPDQMDIQNTIDYIKIDPKSSYKYYMLDLIDDVWQIKETILPETGKISDKAIYILCYPEWISDFKGGSSVEFPTLYLNNSLIKEKDSDEKFEDDLKKLELVAFDAHIFHTPTIRQVQAHEKRILLMESMA